MTKTSGDYIVLLLSIFGSLASIIAFGALFAPSLNGQGWVGVFFLGVYSLVLLAYNYHLVSKYRIKVRYATIFEDLNTAFSNLNYLNRVNAEEIEIIVKLSAFCDKVSDAFGKLNDCRVGVCIKYFNSANSKPRLYTLVRDSFSMTNGRKTGKVDDIEHWVDENTDFKYIYEGFGKGTGGDRAYYYEPHLPTKKGYKNTRLDENWDKDCEFKYFYPIEKWLRNKKWTLKYRSTIVVPIVPLLANEQSSESIRGFICLDTQKEGTFNKQLDVTILKGISDCLYYQVDKLYNFNIMKNG